VVITIKIAIMGAGLSGLACALTLEKYGISPDIFEKRRRVGDRFVNCEIFLSALTRPVKDPVAYLAEEYGLYLNPVTNIRRIKIYSENNCTTINGQIGFTNVRGRNENSLENQLAKQVKSKITYNSTYTYEQLINDYTHVVLATGDAAYTSKIQDIKQDFTVSLRGATVVGKFNRYTVMTWLNNKLAPRGYGYLIPISEKEANIVIGYPDDRENLQNKEGLWDRFYQTVCKDLNQQLKITDNFSITRYIIGICSQARIGNTFFIGNCFGSIMPFLGFGQYASLLSGVYAARAICGKESYEKLTSSLRKSYYNSIIMRKTMEKMNNTLLDKLVQALSGYTGRKILTGQFDYLKTIAFVLKPWFILAGNHKNTTGGNNND
jgi:flavin-dependent dehydrogenase